ncbi:MAG: 3-keto-5-aminohexanoate cleavage protein [Acidiferrobacterales bacterium]
MSEDWSPLILAVAPNGAHRTRHDHPALPITPAEIARAAAESCEAGASMIHLHVRDTAGRLLKAVGDWRRWRTTRLLVAQVRDSTVAFGRPLVTADTVREMST